MTDDEQWISVPGHEGLYEVSDFGRIRSIARYVRTGRGGTGRRWLAARIIYQAPKRGGYMHVWLNKDGKRTCWRVHRLVLTAFVGPGQGLEAMHGPDTDVQNNALANLSWGTPQRNREERHMRYNGHEPGGGGATSMSFVDAMDILNKQEK